MRKNKLSFQLVQVPDLLALLIKCEQNLNFKLLYTPTMNRVFMLSHSLLLSRVREGDTKSAIGMPRERDLMQVFQLRFNTFK